MKIVSGLMISVILLSVLFLAGCAPQGGEEEYNLEVTLYAYSASGCWTAPTFVTFHMDTVAIYAAPKKSGTSQGNITVAFEIVSGPHKLGNLGPDESYEIGELVYACAGPAPSALISDYWKREKVYSDSPPVKYCKTDCNSDPAQFEYSGIKAGTDTIVVSATVDGHELEETATITWQYAENTCVLDLTNNTLSPTNDVVTPVEPLGNGKAVVKINMGAGNYTVLEMKIEIADALLAGTWLLNIGNSPSNNGAGGDNGDFSNDSELDVTSNATYPDFILQLYANQYFSTPGAVVANLVPLFPPGGNVTTWILRVKIANQKMCALVENTGALRGDPDNPAPDSPFIFRLGGLDDEAPGNLNDFIYYAAFNRVIGRPDRTGSGVEKVTFMWRTTWPGWEI